VAWRTVRPCRANSPSNDRAITLLPLPGPPETMMTDLLSDRCACATSCDQVHGQLLIARAHVEQKNWARARELVGYYRYDTDAELVKLNEIWALDALFTNYFLPQQKLVFKQRQGAKVIKKRDTATTPHQRAVTHPDMRKRPIITMNAAFKCIKPAALSRQILALTGQLEILAQAKKAARNRPSTGPGTTPTGGGPHVVQRTNLPGGFRVRQQGLHPWAGSADRYAETGNRAIDESSANAGSDAGCSTTARTRPAMNRAVRTTVPPRVTSATSTRPRPWVTSTRRPARVAVMVYVRLPSPASITISTLSPRMRTFSR
jgi:hypothetical protein